MTHHGPTEGLQRSPYGTKIETSNDLLEVSIFISPPTQLTPREYIIAHYSTIPLLYYCALLLHYCAVLYYSTTIYCALLYYSAPHLSSPFHFAPTTPFRSFRTFPHHSARSFQPFHAIPFRSFHSISRHYTRPPRHLTQPQRGIKQKAATRRLPPCDSARIQTWNRLIRSQVLYSVELRSHCFAFASANIEQIFLLCKYFAKKITKKTTDFSAVFVSLLYIRYLLDMLRKDYFDLLATQILSYELTLW